MEEYIMKKLSKRFLTLAIACVMAMAMAVPTFAAAPKRAAYAGVTTPFFPSRTDCMLLRRMALMFSWLLMRKNGRPSMMAVPLNCSAEPAMHLSV